MTANRVHSHVVNLLGSVSWRSHYWVLRRPTLPPLPLFRSFSPNGLRREISQMLENPSLEEGDSRVCVDYAHPVLSACSSMAINKIG